MPSADKLFRLDPVATKLTAPTTSVQAQSSTVNRSAANNQFSKGLTNFANSVGGLAEKSKQDRIREDVRIAENAALREQVMPGGLLGVAQDAYSNVIDVNVANDSFNEIKAFTESQDAANLINSFEPTGDKINSIDASFNDLANRGLQTIQNPQVLQKYILKVNDLKAATKLDIYKVEDDQQTLQVIKAGSSTIVDAIKFAEATDIPTTDTLTPDWLDNMAKDMRKVKPAMDEAESKLLTFQLLAQNQDLINDSSVISNMLSAKYSKGLTFNNLLVAKGDDADAFRTIMTKYLATVKANNASIKAQQKATDVTNQDETLNGVTSRFFASNGDASTVSADLLNSGHFTVTEANKKQKALETYAENNIKAQLGSKEYYEAVDQVQGQKITLDSQLNQIAIDQNLSKDVVAALKTYMGEEGAQKTAFIKTYDDATKFFTSSAFSLSKLKLKSNDALTKRLFAGEELTQPEMIRLAQGSNMNPEDFQLIINQIDDFKLALKQEAEHLGTQDSIADTADGQVPQEGLTNFRDSIKFKIDQLVTLIDLGLPDDVVDPGTNSLSEVLTLERFPLIITESPDIFKTNTLDSSATDNKTSASATLTFTIANSFEQPENLRAKASIIDATQGSPQELRAQTEALAAKAAEEEKIKARSLMSLADKNVEDGNNILRIGDLQLTVDDFNGAADAVENSITNSILDFINNIRVFSEPQVTPDRVTPKISPNQEDTQEISTTQKIASTVNDLVSSGTSNADAATTGPESKPLAAKGVSFEQATSKGIDKHFSNNDKVKAVFLSQIEHENSSFDPTLEADNGDGGIGLIQFTGVQKVSFKKWLGDKNKDMDTDSTLEYIKELFTANEAWADKYHRIGAGNVKKFKQLSKTGTIEQLSDLVTDIIGPHDPKGTKRAEQKKKRKQRALERFKG